MRRSATLLVVASLGLTGCKACQKEAPVPVSPPQAAPSAPSGHAATGEQTFAEAPPDHGDQFGEGLQLAVDAQGSPLLAYLEHDPSKPEERNAHQVTFMGWDAAKKTFRAPMRVAALLGSPDMHPLALARDAATGTLGLVYVDEGPGEKKRITLALSRDGGLSWNVTALKSEAGGDWPTRPTLALGGGKAYVAWTGNDAFQVIQGALDSDPASWGPPKRLALPAGTQFHTNAPSSLALDAAGHPAIAFAAAGQGTLVFAFARLDGAAVVALDPLESSDVFDLRLAFAGQNPRLVVTAAVKDQEGDAWFLKSDDGGRQFSKPVRIPNDGGRRLDGPIGLAISPSGHVLVSLHNPGGNGVGARCGLPTVSRSDDGAAFTTCSPNADAAVNDSTFHESQAAFDGEKAVVAYVSQKFEEPWKLKVWRER